MSIAFRAIGKVCIKALYMDEPTCPKAWECFNTLPFFAPEEEFHPIGRPFAPCFTCRAQSSLLVSSHGVLVYTKRWWFHQRFVILSSTFQLILNKFLKLLFIKNSFISLLNNTFIQICIIYSFHFLLHKTKNPRVFNPRVLEVCCVYFCVTRQSSGPYY